MLAAEIDPRRVEVWVAIADHFLDTETRHNLPLTALSCVTAGFSPEDARHVFRHEVSPAVAFNLWNVTGEWAFFERDWLVPRVASAHARWARRGRVYRFLRSRTYVELMPGVCEAIERCIRVLRESPPGAREQLARDLGLLARYFFDFAPIESRALDAAALARLRALYPAPFCHALAPALAKGEAAHAALRVEAALANRAT